MRTVRRARRPLLALVALLVALAVGYAVRAASSDEHPQRSHTPMAAPSQAELPPEIATTIGLIEAGGPFPYPAHDGAVFHNLEHRLPSEPDGYYHEYTVPTPGTPDRGARRIITGAHGEYWYTGDHYETFLRLAVHEPD